MSAFQRVSEAARGRWPGILARLGVDSSSLEDRHGPCPGCGGRDRFRFDDRDGSGSWLCSQGGGGTVSGDGFALLEHVHGWDAKRQLKEVAALLGVAVGDGSARAARDAEEEARRGAKVEREPRRERGPKRPPFDPAKLERFAAACGERIGKRWLWERSPVCPMWGAAQGIGAAFLEALYEPGERVLVFEDYFSQGDFLHEAGRGSYRLAQDPRVKAKQSRLPASGPKGVWFLTNPVSGEWLPGKGRASQPAKLGRRHEGCVTAWRYAVLESDEAPPALWLRALALLELRVAAIYTSGGRSVHALVRLDAASKADFDACRDLLGKVLCPLGADGGALSGVRLSRLPGCLREEKGRVQDLLYLDPAPRWGRLLDLRKVREAPAAA